MELILGYLFFNIHNMDNAEPMTSELRTSNIKIDHIFLELVTFCLGHPVSSFAISSNCQGPEEPLSVRTPSSV